MSSVKITGPFVDILKQFSLEHRLGHGEAGNSERLAVLCNVLDAPRSTVENWFKNDITPTSGNMRKVELMLSLCGYESEERRSFSPMIRLFVDTLTTTVSIEEAAQQLGGTSENIKNWVRGTSQPKNVQDIIAFNDLHTSQRVAKVKEWRRCLEDGGFIVAVSKTEEVVLVKATSVPGESEKVDMQQIDQAIAHQAKALLSMIRSSDVLANGARKKTIRQAVGYDDLAKLVGDLQRISMADFNFTN
jgi:DNA-binding transcriptional regulator YiaG